MILGDRIKRRSYQTLYDRVTTSGILSKALGNTPSAARVDRASRSRRMADEEHEHLEKVSSLSLKDLRALVKEAGLSSDDCITYPILRLRAAEAVERLFLPGWPLGPISKKLGLGADADPKSALVLAQLTARGVASGAVEAAAIAAELKAQDGHVGRTVNRLMNRLRAGEHMAGAGEAASSGTVAPEVAAALEREHEELVWQLVDAREQKKRDDKDKAAQELKRRGGKGADAQDSGKEAEEPKEGEEHPLALGNDPFAGIRAAKASAKLAEVERRQAEHESELQKVDELLKQLDAKRSSKLVAGLTERKQALQEEKERQEQEQWEAASQASHTSQTPAQAAAQALQAAEAMQAEAMQAEAAKAQRASHLQACAEACAKGYHRPSRGGACAEQRGRASPAPSVGSVGSVGSSHLLVGGGNYSKRFSGPLPDHMPPAPEPTPEMLRSSSSQALLRARRSNSGQGSGLATPTREALEQARRVLGESSQDGAKRLEPSSRTSSFASTTARPRVALRKSSATAGATAPLQRPERRKSGAPRSASFAVESLPRSEVSTVRSAHDLDARDLSLPRWASEPLDTLGAQRLSAARRPSLDSTEEEVASMCVGGQLQLASRPIPEAPPPPRAMRIVNPGRRSSKLRPARARVSH